MRPARLVLCVLLALSSLAIAQEVDVLPAYTDEQVASMSNEELLNLALAGITDDSTAAALEACVAIDFASVDCGGLSGKKGTVVWTTPTCIAEGDAWLPETCGDLFEPSAYVNLTLRDRWGYFKACLSGDTHESDSCH